MAVESARDADAFRAFEHAGWQRASGAYERYWGQVTAQTAEPLLDAAGVAEGSRMLDVCCGPGLLAGAALARGAEAHGVDLSENFVSIARQRHPGAQFRTGDAEDLPFPDDGFDAAVCGYGIIHVPRPATVLSEMVRTLRPGGRMAASVWASPEPGTGFGVVYAAVTAHADSAVPLPHGPDFFQFSAADALADALAGAGLEDVSTRRVEQTFRIDGPDTLFATITDAAVRLSGLLRAQSADRLAAIRAALAAGLAALPDPTTLSMPAVVASGRKPG